MRRLAAVVGVATLVGVLAGCRGGSPAELPEVRRVLVVTLPGASWEELDRADLPVLRRFVAEAAVGDASTRVGRVGATTTEAYLTMGAGTRSVVPAVDVGVALDPQELHGGVPVEELVERRQGEPGAGIAYLPVGATIEANEQSAFGSEPGRLGDALASAGVGRAVIANADAAEGFPSDLPPPGGAFSRSAATVLMGSDGLVPAGEVGRTLLADDPGAPFGRRLDPDAVLDAFDAAWTGPERTVVLVEGSDLARASAYEARAEGDQGARLRREALRSTDELLGELLERVDPAHDAVLVVAPTSPSTLGAVALRAPGVDRGLLRSPSTRRDGYVYLADLMPSILHLVGVTPPDDVEGRSVEVAPATGDRVDRLRSQADAAEARDARLPLVVVAVIAALGALVLAVARRDRLPTAVVRMLRPLALAAIGVVPGTYLAGIVPAARTGPAAFAAVVLAVAALVGLVASVADRRWRGCGPLVAVGSVIALVVVDVLAGTPLQVNTVFGYSMTVAGRFTGLGNLAFALFSVSVVAMAVLLHERYGPRSLLGLGLLLAGAVVIDGFPLLGADVGGVIATVPAFVLVLLALRGRPIGWRQVVLAGALGGAMVVAFGLVDSALPEASQTHLARLGAHASGGRFGSIATVLWRRVHASFGGDGIIVGLLAVGAVTAAAGQAWVVASGRWAAIRGWLRTDGDLALAYGVGVLAVLGTVANDSSVAVPATMLIVLVPVLVLRRLPA